jgi:hypothetical protein
MSYHVDNPSRVAPQIESVVLRFGRWLDRFGETSHDYQSYFASGLGRRAKALYYRRPLLGTLAVAPMVLSEAFLPSARGLFAAPQRFPIADAHYAMAYAFMAERFGKDAYYRRAVHFLEVLKDSRCPAYEDYGWGYPFHWETRTGCIRAGTPLITTLPYVYEAFAHVHRLDGADDWRRIMRSIAEHALTAYRDLAVGPDGATCAYTPSPEDPCGVVNASAYRAFLLTQAAHDLADERYLRVAERNLNFVLAAQEADGSWPYAIDGQRGFVDHFHTCFVLKALAKIEQLTGSPRCTEAIARGVGYYVVQLFDADGLPRPFARAPRLTVYRRELYDYAECLNLAVLLRGRFPSLDARLSRVVVDVLQRWVKPDGSFRTRQLLVGWDNVPLHRWAQAQMFRSLCVFVSRSARESRPRPETVQSDSRG